MKTANKKTKPTFSESVQKVMQMSEVTGHALSEAEAARIVRVGNRLTRKLVEICGSQKA